jgi:hypothetical protein
MVFAGPGFDGVMLLAQVIGDGLKRAPMAELEESQEGAEGAWSFAGGAGETGLRVER